MILDNLIRNLGSFGSHFSEIPLDDQGELVAAVPDELLGLVVGHLEDVDAVDLDQVVVGPAAGLARHAVQGNLSEGRKVIDMQEILRAIEG